MTERENDKLSNDFNVSQQAAAMQKSREKEAMSLLDPTRQQQEMKRQSELEKIKDDKARQDIARDLAERDKTITDNLERLKKDQITKLNAEISKEVNKQGNPVLEMMNFSGRSPQVATQKVQARMLPEQQKEQEAYVRGSYDIANSPIDKKIQKAIEHEQAQESHRQKHIENRLPEEVFEKPTGERTSKDAFTQAHDRKGGEKDWRSLAAERKTDDHEL